MCGESATSLRAIHNAKHLLLLLDGEYHFEVIDVLKEPQRAEDARILATPTLVKSEPPPLRIVVGDLSNFSRIKAVLNLPLKREEG